MLDLEALLAPVADQPPSGPDLEYDPEWQELERLAQGKPEQQFGNTIIPAEEPDWRDVVPRASKLLGRSKDVRSACLLARAQVSMEQFSGLLPGLNLVHQLMDRYWDSVHPQLDASDSDDPTMRINALAWLADPQGLVRSVRTARLFQTRAHGDLTVRQIEIAAGKLTAREGEAVPTLSQVEQNITSVATQDAELGKRVADTLAAAKGLAAMLDGKVGASRSPDLKPLIDSLSVVAQVVGRATASLQGAAGEGGESAEAGAAGGAGPAINAASGTIRSRADVVLLLDRICEFLQRTEPTSPAPLLLLRAKKLMNMNFIDILSEMAPDGLDQARIVTGVKAEESE